MLELYHDWDSVCSVKVRFCLAEKGLDWIDRRIDLCAFEHMTPEYLKLNPMGVVPTLVHDGNPVIESTVINEYLDEVFPDPPMRPADPLARAKMRVWTKFEDDVLHPSIRPASYNLMIKLVVKDMTDEQIDQLAARHPNKDRAANWRRTAREPADMAAVQEAADRADTALQRLEENLVQGGPWLAGEAFSLADMATAPMIDRMEWLEMAGLWKNRPALSDWIHRIKSRPAYVLAFPDSDHRLPGPKNVTTALYPGAAQS